MAIIDVGSPAVDRAYSTTENVTWVNATNPANESGKITTIEIYALVDLDDCTVATFWKVSGLYNLSGRDSVNIGAVTAGAKRTFTEDSGGNPISLTVEAGDYIGFYTPLGEVEKDNVGYGNVWYKDGNQISCVDLAFNRFTGDTCSLYGIGATLSISKNAIFFGSNF